MDCADQAGEAALTVRPMEPRDSAAVADLVTQLGYTRSVDQVRDWIEGVSSPAATQTALVACLGEEICGWIEISIGLHLQTPPFALIGGLVVKGGVRGKGIGKLLCEKAERWARERGVETMRVTSRSTREQAHRFYLRDGYRAVKTSVVFEKQLGE